jgi:hypothetical protein
VTDRDTFAAAALTGLLAAPTGKDRSLEYWARFSYEIADAMLRERGGTEPMPKEKRAEVSYTLTAEEREAIDFACMNLMETTRRAMQRCHADEDIAPVSKARATLRALLERTQ